MKKIIMTLCLLVSCSSFASTHLTHNQVNEFKIKLVQVKDDIREIQKEIVELKNSVLTQQLSNTQIVPLRNQLSIYEGILDGTHWGDLPEFDWVFHKTTDLDHEWQRKKFYLKKKIKAYERIAKNYVALITYINTKTISDTVSIQGDFNFSVNGETVLDY